MAFDSKRVLKLSFLNNILLKSSKSTVYLVVLFLIFAFSMQLNAQKTKQNAIYLKNGELVYGKIVSNDSINGVRLENECGVKIYKNSEIDSIKPFIDQIYTLKTKGYFNLSSLALLFGEGRDGYVPVPSLTMVNGYQFNASIFTGIGLGYEYYEWSVMPIFLEAKYMLQSRSVKPFASIKIGYGLSLRKEDSTNDGDNIGKTYGGVQVAPEIGVAIPIGSVDAFLISIGYHHQQLSYDKVYYYWDGPASASNTLVHTNYNRISFRLAFMFR